MDSAFHQQALQNYADMVKQMEGLKLEHDSLQKYLESLGLIEKKAIKTRTRKSQTTAT